LLFSALTHAAPSDVELANSGPGQTSERESVHTAVYVFACLIWCSEIQAALRWHDW